MVYISDMAIAYDVGADGCASCGLTVNALSNTNKENLCRGSWRLGGVGAHISLWRSPQG